VLRKFIFVTTPSHTLHFICSAFGSQNKFGAPATPTFGASAAGGAAGGFGGFGATPATPRANSAGGGFGGFGVRRERAHVKLRSPKLIFKAYFINYSCGFCLDSL
jgi:hypothetical protein